MADDYAIHDLTIMDVPGLTGGLHPNLTKRVLYYVGKHGPFQLNYTQQEFNSALVQNDIQKQVQTLRDIAGLATGSK